MIFDHRTAPLRAHLPSVERLSGMDDPSRVIQPIFDNAEQEDFQYGLDWLRLLYDTTLRSEGELELHLACRGSVPVGLLPLLRTAGRHGPEYRTPANFYTTRSLPMLGLPAGDGDAALMLLRHLRETKPRAHRVNFAPIDRLHPSFERSRAALRRAGFVVFEYFCYGNWRHSVVGDADAYLATRPGALRSTLRRMSRRIDKAAGHIEIVGPDGDVERALAAYEAVYAKSWKGGEPHADFIPSLVRLCARRGWLRLGLVWLDGRPAAAQIWVVAQGQAHIFKLAYDEACAELSPGTVLTAALMRHVIDVDRVREIDYMTGDDAYKASWMSHRRELWGLVAYDPACVAGVAGALREAAAKAVRGLQRAMAPLPR